jgi:hypothetical protein
MRLPLRVKSRPAPVVEQLTASLVRRAVTRTSAINVWCFSAKADAEKYQAQFGGEYMTPEDRPSGDQNAGERTKSRSRER